MDTASLDLTREETELAKQLDWTFRRYYFLRFGPYLTAFFSLVGFMLLLSFSNGFQEQAVFESITRDITPGRILFNTIAPIAATLLIGAVVSDLTFCRLRRRVVRRKIRELSLNPLFPPLLKKLHAQYHAIQDIAPWQYLARDLHNPPRFVRKAFTTQNSPKR